MKKKLLSVLMAGTLVATSSVSAFATVDYEKNENETIEHNVNITGDVANDTGDIKPGTIQVTVPTAASFQVDKDGVFTAGNITINNRGTSNVDVLAYKFVDTNGEAGIFVQEKSEVTTDQTNVTRDNMALSIQGNRGTVYLSSDNNSSGIFEDDGLLSEIQDGKVISQIIGGQADALKLVGETGKNKTGITSAIQDRFTLTLKIVKSTN